jgi:serine/threonine-protein kinase
MPAAKAVAKRWGPAADRATAVATGPVIELHVLGDPQITCRGTALALQRKPLALLAYLALAGPGRLLQRDTLLGVFWPDLDQSRARAALRQALHVLRQALGETVILTEGDERVGLRHAAVQCDAVEFDLAIREGQLRTAVELYRGAVLSGLHLDDLPEFEHWLDGQRGPRQRAYEPALEQLAAWARSMGDHRRAADWLRQLLRVDPLSGRVATLLMEELEAAGTREDAIAAGERYVADLRREWDAAPDPHVRDLLARLRTAPAPAEAPALPTAAPPRCHLELVREALMGRYDVLEELGGGGMAKVFLAFDPKLRRHVAVKVLRPEIRRAVGTERFLQEIAIIAAFNHPNIIPLFEADDLGGFLYYAMRHVPGEPLSERIRRKGCLPVADAVAIARDVARALEYSHQQHVVHRDTKPRNILLHEGVALIADFGTALVVAGGGRRLTESGLLVGTPEYMSPEQADPECRPDARSDVYALGCVIYEMLAGEPVYRGATTAAVFAKHRSERIPSVRVTRPDVPPALEAIVTRALAKVPAERFPSAAALAQSLDGCPVEPRPGA